MIESSYAESSSAAATHKYLYIYNDLRRDIILNKYPAGTLLPTEAELMQKYSAGRNTVRHAIRLLRDDELVSSQQGSGMTVLSVSDRGGVRHQAYVDFSSLQFNINYMHDGKEVTIHDVSVASSAPAADMIPAPPEAARAFNIPEGSVVCRLQRLWSINGTVYCYMIQYFNCAVLPGILGRLGDKVSDIYRVLPDYGLHFLDGKETIDCLNAGFLEANLLNVDLGTALLHTVRIARCESGIFEYADIYANPKYTSYSVNLHPDPVYHDTPQQYEAVHH